MLQWQHSYLEDLLSWIFMLFYTKWNSFQRLRLEGGNIACETSSPAVETGITCFSLKRGVTMKDLNLFSVSKHKWNYLPGLAALIVLLPATTCPSLPPATSLSFSFTTYSSHSSLQSLGFQVILTVGKLCLLVWGNRFKSNLFLWKTRSYSVYMLCIYYTAKNPPWDSNWRLPNVNTVYCWVYLWKNLHLCCFVPTVTQDFRERNIFMEWHELLGIYPNQCK